MESEGAELRSTRSSICRSGIMRAIVSFVLLFSLALIVCAQDNDIIPPDASPPPIKMLSKDEKSVLAASKDVKARTKLTLELMDSRVKSAEQFLMQERLELVFRELGGFHALVFDVLDFLASSDSNAKKVLDNFKRFEIGLRGFTHRIELIRREMPPQREYYVRLLLREMRDARAKAVEPLFGEISSVSDRPTL